MRDLVNHKGVRFSAYIADTAVEGKIQVENNEVYLCQDKVAGNSCKDRLGYKYSWYIGNGNKNVLDCYKVSNLKFHYTAAQIEAYKDWEVGDILRDSRNDYFEVIFRSGEVVVLKDSDTNRVTSVYTCDELYKDGYRLKATPIEDDKNFIEITIDEIAKLLKISPEKIRIKKE